MKTNSAKNGLAVDLRSRDAVAQFRRAADALSKRIADSPNPQQAARDLMVREGLLTPKGRLTSRYK